MSKPTKHQQELKSGNSSLLQHYIDNGCSYQRAFIDTENETMKASSGEPTIKFNKLLSSCYALTANPSKNNHEIKENIKQLSSGFLNPASELDKQMCLHAVFILSEPSMNHNFKKYNQYLDPLEYEDKFFDTYNKVKDRFTRALDKGNLKNNDNISGYLAMAMSSVCLDELRLNKKHHEISINSFENPDSVLQLSTEPLISFSGEHIHDAIISLYRNIKGGSKDIWGKYDSLDDAAKEEFKQTMFLQPSRKLSSDELAAEMDVNVNTMRGERRKLMKFVKNNIETIKDLTSSEQVIY